MLQYARCCARMISIMARKRIGTVLEEKGLINEFQLVAALSHQRKWKIKLGKSLMELGYLEEGDLYEVLAEQLGMDLIDLKKREIPPEVLGLLSREQGRAYLTVPVEQEGDTLVMAVAEPDRPELQEELEKITGQSVRLVLATESDINAKIRKLPEKVSVATVQPVKKAFRRNQEGDIQPIEEEPVEPGPLPQDQMLSAEVPEIPGESGEEKIEAVPVELNRKSFRQLSRSRLRMKFHPRRPKNPRNLPKFQRLMRSVLLKRSLLPNLSQVLYQPKNPRHLPRFQRLRRSVPLKSPLLSNLSLLRHRRSRLRKKK
jgi:hypothetical protein